MAEMAQEVHALRDDARFSRRLRWRNLTGKTWRWLFLSSLILSLVVLVVLLLHIINSTIGLVVISYNVDPRTLADQPLSEMEKDEMLAVVLDTQGDADRTATALLREGLSVVPTNRYRVNPLRVVFAGSDYPVEWAELRVDDLSVEQKTTLLLTNLSDDALYDVIITAIAQPRVVRSWKLLDSITQREEIDALVAEQYPDDELTFRSWINFDFLSSKLTSSATTAGLRIALMGTFWIMGITALIAFPIGVGAAIYLEEYATDNWLNRIIEINIRNLAAVPSIIYGLLGLAVFVRALGDITSGSMFGVTDSNGRTIISAAATLALLILPVIIIASQEAIRAVPNTIREASYGLGATRWQTVSRQVLPVGMPGIMTGVILAIARAIGETAPLLVVGASTFIATDPTGPFSKFTVVPIQIFQWTSNPDQEFRNIAAAASVTLLVLMVVISSVAIVIRSRLSRRL
jgi:phosphate transport system permease protein